MEIDLSFTKNPEWIKKREIIWEKMQIGYSSEVTKKQKDILHGYFMTGIPPKELNQIHQFAYIDLFPLQTEQGLSFCFREYFDITLGYVRGDWQNYIWRLYADRRYDVSRQDAINLFHLFCGKIFSPKSIFPFTSKGEIENREVLIDPYLILSIFINTIQSWLQTSDQNEDAPICADLVDYMFSIFPYLDDRKINFIMPLTPPNSMEYEKSVEISDTIGWCKRIHNFLRIFYSKKIYSHSEQDRHAKLDYVNRVSSVLDGMVTPQYSQILIDHWQWVKEGKKLRNTPPPKT